MPLPAIPMEAIARLEERIIAQGNLVNARFDALDEKMDIFCKGADDREERIRALEGRQGWAVWRDIGAAVAGAVTGIVAIITAKP